MARKPQAPSGDAAEPGFDQALAELERLVARLESGELSLEEALAAHRRGMELVKRCHAYLAAAEQQVKVLEGETLKPLAASAAAPASGDEADDD